MTLIKYWLFWKSGNTSRIYSLPCIEEHFDTVYHRIIVTSETMIHLIRNFMLNNFCISSIVLSKDMADIQDKVCYFLERTDENPVYLIDLTYLLTTVSEKSSIGIQKVCFTHQEEDGTSAEGFIQSDGLFGSDAQISNNVLCIIEKTVKECVFGN